MVSNRGGGLEGESSWNIEVDRRLADFFLDRFWLSWILLSSSMLSLGRSGPPGCNFERF